MGQAIEFPKILGQLMEEKYRRNRVALAEAAHISPSALSQYVHGRSTPSLDVLVKLAEVLDVSLDFLVLGRERTVPPPELGYLPYVEAHMRTAQSQAVALNDLVARIGARVGENVRNVAEEFVAEAVITSGTLSPAEVALLERCSHDTTIVITDLSTEIMILRQDGVQTAAPSVFAQVVVDNINDGVHYEYIIPYGPKWVEEARMLRNEFARLGGFSPQYLAERLAILHVSRACAPGYIVQHVNLARLQRQAASVYECVDRFVYNDPENDEMGFVAYTEMTSPNNQHFDLISRERVIRVLDELEELRKDAARIAKSNQHSLR